MAMKKQMHIKVVMYVRTSTTDKESGLDTQKKVITKKIKSQGYRNIVETFVNEAIPKDGETEDSLAFKAMLSFIEKHNKENPKDSIKKVWVQTRDRIASDVDIMGYVSVILRRIRVSIVSTEEDNGTSTRRIHDALGEEELKKYRQKRIQSIERRLGQQKIMSRVPLVYKVDDGELVVDEEMREKLKIGADFTGTFLEKLINKSISEEFISAVYQPVFELNTPNNMDRYENMINKDITSLKSIRERIGFLFSNTQESSNKIGELSKKVFIVHGHDNELKETVARFIEKIGLEAVILHEKPSKGMTLINKFEEYADVSFAIVHQTPMIFLLKIRKNNITMVLQLKNKKDY